MYKPFISAADYALLIQSLGYVWDGVSITDMWWNTRTALNAMTLVGMYAPTLLAAKLYDPSYHLLSARNAK